VTVLFADIKGFTSLCHQIPPTRVMHFLNHLYSRLDTLLDVYGVYKVETIGDCYMVAGGLMTRDSDGFMAVRGPDSVDELHAAKASRVLLPTTRRPVEMRIGLHSGAVMSGIVGAKMPRFCLFGDTVNTASRMESTCTPGAIHVSAATRALLPEEEWEPTGGVQVGGWCVYVCMR
ncbi:guanylyl and adenylyl cyclase family member, partial [Volvox carteri f. nagariensis]